MQDVEQMQELIDTLNRYRDAYYNNNTMLVTDEQYDELFDKLKEMEDKTGILFSNSPTQTVGYSVQSKLSKVTHDHPMLSLGKTKELDDVIKFAGGKPIIAMLKMDGLTCSLHYDESGNLTKAETRGNGEVGEDVLANAKHIANIPLKIDNGGVPLTIDGEVIVDYDTFNNINSKLNDEDKYSHPRNLASGSIRQLDTKVTADRKLKFIAWRVIEGLDKFNNHNFCDILQQARDLGFEVVPFIYVLTAPYLNEAVDKLKALAKEKSYPIDGLVFSYNDMEYGTKLGNTSHHPNHSIAFKFYDDCYETVLRNIEWNTTRTGMIAPVAVFDPVDLDGAITTRATLHNISIMRELKLGIGDTITVFRANAVIPKVNENLTKSDSFEIPAYCPCCGEPTIIKKDGIAEVLYCINTNCSAKNLAKFVHFVSKPCMNIDGLSEATLEKFIGAGYIKKYADIYHLDRYKDEIIAMEGFGEKSYNKLIQSIEASRDVTLENFITALGIPNIGKTAARTISKQFNGDHYLFVNALSTDYNFGELEDFGETMNKSIHDWWDAKEEIVELLPMELHFITKEKEETSNLFIAGKTFVVTGAFKTMKRGDLEKLITDNGGKLSGSVSKKTDYLLTNETAGTTKYNKAMELGIPIMSEEEFLGKVN